MGYNRLEMIYDGPLTGHRRRRAAKWMLLSLTLLALALLAVRFLPII